MERMVKCTATHQPSSLGLHHFSAYSCWHVGTRWINGHTHNHTHTQARISGEVWSPSWANDDVSEQSAASPALKTPLSPLSLRLSRLLVQDGSEMGRCCHANREPPHHLRCRWNRESSMTSWNPPTAPETDLILQGFLHLHLFPPLNFYVRNSCKKYRNS